MAENQDTNDNERSPAPDANLATVTTERDRLQLQIEELGNAIVDLDLRGTEDAGACEVAVIRLRELTAERDTLKRQLAAQKGVATRAKNEAAELTASRKPRDFLGVKPMERDRLLAAIAEADEVELAFADSDGKEIPGLPSRAISGPNPFSSGLAGVRLQVPELTVHGPAQGQDAFLLAGYVLLLDGKPTAVAVRNDVLPIGAGRTVNLKDDVIF